MRGSGRKVLLMKEPADLPARLSDLGQLLSDKLGVSGDLSARLERGARQMPRKLRSDARLLQAAEKMIDNPRLAMILDDPRYARAADAIEAHLSTIDMADRRKGYWLGVLGGLAFNLLAALVLFLVALRIFELI